MAFGVMVVLVNEREYQVATFRRDVGIRDGRHPERIVYTDNEKEDILRRDFTINGLLLDPVDGRIIDYVDGKNDIERRVVKTIGDPAERFEEDRLRMLRAVRFATVLDFSLDRPTAMAVKDHAAGIAALSYERITDELRRILVHRNREHGARMMHELGLLKEILPEVAACQGVEQDRSFHPEGDVLEHTFQTLGCLRSPDFPLALAALLHDVGKPGTRREADRIRFHRHDKLGAEMAESACRRLRLSNAERAKVVELVGKHMHFINMRKMREAKLRKFLESDHAQSHIELHRADCLASHCKLDNLKHIGVMRRKWARLPEIRKPLLRGRDLLAMGFREGPEIGRILKKIHDLQLEGKLRNMDEAVEWIKQGGHNTR